MTAQEVHLGAGSVALLSQFLLAVCEPGSEVVYAWRSFEAYPGLVTVAGGTSVQVPLTADARHDLDAMAAAVTDRDAGGARLLAEQPDRADRGRRGRSSASWTACPPTCSCCSTRRTSSSSATRRRSTASTLIGRWPNLVVLRTFSKAWGLAGPAARLRDRRRSTSSTPPARSAIPLSVTGQAQLAGLVALDHEDLLLARVARHRRDPRPARGGAARRSASTCRTRRATSCGCRSATGPPRRTTCSTSTASWCARSPATGSASPSASGSRSTASSQAAAAPS